MPSVYSLALSEFRANAASTIALVERGATVRLLRHGKPVADLVPVTAAVALPSDTVAADAFLPVLGLPDGQSAVRALLGERDRSDW